MDSVRMLLLDDGANPCKFQCALAFVCNTQYTISMQHTSCDFGCVCDFTAGSLASSDLFYDAYGPKGLAREALCPCAGSPETLTVSVRRWLPILKYDSIGIAFFMLPPSSSVFLPPFCPSLFPSDPLLLPLLVVVSCPSLVLAMVWFVLRNPVALHHSLYRMLAL